MPNFSQAILKFTQAPISQPQVADNAVIALPCRLDGDFKASISNTLVATRFPTAEEQFRLWWRSQLNFKLGEIKVVTLNPSIHCAFLIDHPADNLAPLQSCLKKLSDHAQINKLSVHIKKPSDIDKYNSLLPIINQLFINKNINVWFYE
jgi:hypothetical protein